MPAEIVAFEQGVKPAVMNIYQTKKGAERVSEDSSFFNDLKDRYPYTVLPPVNRVVFFQNEEANQAFQARCTFIVNEQGVKVVDTWDDTFLSEALGYPPQAIAYFDNKITQLAKGNFLKEDKLKEANIDYYGIKFVCAKEDVGACLTWLVQNRPIPKDLELEGDIFLTYHKMEEGKVVDGHTYASLANIESSVAIFESVSA